MWWRIIRGGEGIKKDVYSRNNLPNTVKDGVYVANLDEYKLIGTYCIPLCMNDNSVTYFDSFGIEHVPKETKTFIIKYHKKIFRIQTYDSIIRWYFCVGFINFRFKGKSLTDFTGLF